AESFATGEAFLREQRTADPSCLVLDVRLPQMSGLDFQRKLAEVGVQIPIIFITAHGDIPMSVRALKSGAVEFLTKPFRDQDLLDAIQQALQRDRVAREQQAEINAVHERYEALTAREREVMALVVSDMLNKHIAAKIGASEATVKIHRGHVMEKIQAGSLVELVRMADKLKLSPNKKRLPPPFGTRLRLFREPRSYWTTTSVVVHADLGLIASFCGQRYSSRNGHRTQLKRSRDPRRRRVGSDCAPGSDRIGGAVRALLQLRRAIPGFHRPLYGIVPDLGCTDARHL